jgi:prepilin peptidase CpaA
VATLTLLGPLFIFCCGAALADIRLHRVPNVYNAAFAVGGVCFASARGGLSGALMSLLGALAGASLLLLPFFLRMVGGGDVKFIGAAGAIVSLHLIWPAFLLGAAAGGILSLIAVAFKARSLGAVTRMLVLLENGSWRVPENLAAADRIRLPYTVPLSIGLLVVASMSVIS